MAMGSASFDRARHCWLRWACLYLLLFYLSQHWRKGGNRSTTPPSSSSFGVAVVGGGDRHHPSSSLSSGRAARTGFGGPLRQQTLACRLEDILRMPLLSASSLEVETRLGKSEITLIAALLSRSHCLETFSIRIKTMDVFEYDVIPHLIAEIANWEFLEFTLGELQLKTVTIHNFLESLPNELCPTTAASLDIGKFMENLEEMKLVRALLKGCKMLDISALIIRTAKLSSWSLKYSELLRRLTKEMLVLPRASARAELHFSHMA